MNFKPLIFVSMLFVASSMFAGCGASRQIPQRNNTKTTSIKIIVTPHDPAQEAREATAQLIAQLVQAQLRLQQQFQ